MSSKERLKTIMDREKMHTTPQCPACGKGFTMGESVVLACGEWQGVRFVHENDAVFDETTDSFVEKKCYAQQQKT